jgi:hypothetical protein
VWCINVFGGGEKRGSKRGKQGKQGKIMNPKFPTCNKKKKKSAAVFN